MEEKGYVVNLKKDIVEIIKILYLRTKTEIIKGVVYKKIFTY